MDDHLTERLSRYLDDDLTDTERTEFDRLLKTDSELRSELDGARRLRQTIASIASGMEPPAELDQVMEPLRQGAPAPQRRIRPVYRWLGAAAAVVLGVTVTYEMVLRNPSPTTVKPTRTTTATSDDREIFELAPLPTAVPNDNRPIGATDRLLEEQPPPPAAPEPSALEVVGPLTADEFSTATENAPAALKKDKALADTEIHTGDDAPSETQAVRRNEDQPAELTAGRHKKRDDTSILREADVVVDRQRSDRSAVAAQVAGELQQTEPSGKATAAAPEAGRGAMSDAPSPIASVVLGDAVLWSGSPGGCPVGQWPTLLIVRDQMVVRVVDQVHRTGNDTVVTCLPEGLQGATLADTEDGELMVTIVVE